MCFSCEFRTFGFVTPNGYFITMPRQLTRHMIQNTNANQSWHQFGRHRKAFFFQVFDGARMQWNR